MTKKIDEMTKEELVQALIDRTEKYYDRLNLAEKDYGYGSSVFNKTRSYWYVFDKFCRDLGIDVDATKEEELI